MKVLVTGANGLLGTKVVERLRSAGYHVIPTHHSRPVHHDSVPLDITKEEAVVTLLDRFRPDFVVHAAAETNVDLCERDSVHAHEVNVEGTKTIAMTCSRIGAGLIYISTDYVFSGEKGFYTEEDAPSPINIYGLTKLRGEEEVRNHCKDFLILRTSVNFGWHPFKQSFATWVISSLRQRKEIRVVTDHYNTPTLTNSLAEVIGEALEERLTGLYHASGDERISRYEFAVMVAEKFELPKELVKPIEMKDLTSSGVWTACRPRDSSLCISKIIGRLKTRPIDVDEALRVMKGEELNISGS